ncbi:MAG: HD domain-containing protein [Halanaerobiales bacterium]
MKQYNKNKLKETHIFEELKEWFEGYVKEFYQNQEDREEIDLKYKHSYRVYKNSNRLAKDIGLSDEDLEIANIIGLFHDLGRFEQFKRYKTFSDSDSLNHGELSVKLLKEYKLLEDLSAEKKHIIYQAIHNHNKLNIPESTTGQALLFSRLIRDADKLDIWSIFARRYHNGNNNEKINLDLSSKNGITPEIYHRVLDGKPVLYSSLQTVDDFKLIQLGWVYDLNFVESLILLKEKNFLEKIYQSMNQSVETEKIYNKINEYINNKIDKR